MADLYPPASGLDNHHQLPPHRTAMAGAYPESVPNNKLPSHSTDPTLKHQRCHSRNSSASHSSRDAIHPPHSPLQPWSALSSTPETQEVEVFRELQHRPLHVRVFIRQRSSGRIATPPLHTQPVRPALPGSHASQATVHEAHASLKM